MGLLLKILKPAHQEPEVPRIFVNLKNFNPSQSEIQLFNECEEITKQIPSILEAVGSYGDGATDIIRKAYSQTSNVEVQEETWNELQPLVEKLKNIRKFSEQITKILPRILKELCINPNIIETLEQKPGTLTQFGQILDFSIRFDTIKNSFPAIQNDLSYYKRLINRDKLQIDDDTLVIGRSESNALTTFLAWPTPFLSIIINTTKDTFLKNEPTCAENMSLFLSTMIKLCRHMLVNPDLTAQFKDEESKTVVLRLMVGLIVLFDHLNEHGSFHKNAGFDVKLCIRVLKEYDGEDNVNLLNTLKYTCKHLNDTTTSNSIRQMLDT